MKIKINTKYNTVLRSIKHLKDWMFVNNELTSVEILPPTLDNITMMKEYNNTFVLKGFKSLVEYERMENIRFKHGFYSMMFLSRSMSNGFIINALTSMMNEQPLPSSEEVEQDINDNMFKIVDEKEEKRINEKIKYKKLYQKYSILLHRQIMKMIKQNRIELLS